MICVSNLSTLNVLDEGYFRNASYALNLLSTFFLFITFAYGVVDLYVTFSVRGAVQHLFVYGVYHTRCIAITDSFG